jgi:hypothetical protein
MGATLTGQIVSETYDSLLKVTDNGVITGTKKRVTDGYGNDTPLLLSSTDVQIDGNLLLSGTTSQYVRGDGAFATFTSGLTSVGLTLGSSGTDASVSGSPLTSNGAITLNLPTASATNRGLLSSTDWSTFNSKQGALTLTTSGSSGASTLVGSALNIPNYTLSGLGGVPYTGATANVDLGTHTLSAYNLIVNHTSGSGNAVSITKGGSGEALTITKTSGSGNAVSISGGVTLISELHLTTDLADAYIASASTWNAKESALTFSSPLSRTTNTISIPAATSSVNGYLTSTDWTTFNNKVPTSRTLTINGTAFDLSADRTWTIGGTGISTLNTLTASTQTFAVGTSGTDFAISSATSTHTFNLPTASATNRGALSSADWSTFNGKQATITGGATTITSSNLTASRALVSDGSGKVAVATTTSTEIGYVNGVTSAIQTQIDAKADKTTTFNIQTGTSYTLALTDAGKIIEMQNGGANIVYIPFNSSVAFPIGTEIQVLQFGAGQTTITPVSGVTTKSKSNQVKIGNQYTGVTLVKRGTNDWYIIGNLTA